MRDIFETGAIDEFSDRLNKLIDEGKARWGKFNVSRLICHLIDNLEYSLGEKEEAKELIKGPPMFIRSFVRLYLPWPKNLPTGSDMLQTKPGELLKDKNKVIKLMNQLFDKRNQETWPLHPFFGKLNGRSWAKLLYRHIDYHLNQFGV